MASLFLVFYNINKYMFKIKWYKMFFFSTSHASLNYEKKHSV